MDPDPELAKKIAADIAVRMERSKIDIPIGVSNRHCHLTEEHFKTLFGAGSAPKRVKDIKQPGFWAAAEAIEVHGPGGAQEGPPRRAYRPHTQIEVAVTDALALASLPKVSPAT